MSELSDFLDYIWGKSEGFVYIPVRTSEGNWKPSWPQWPNQREQIIEFIPKMLALQAEVYISPVLWNKPKAGEKFSSALFKQSNVLWAEFDGNAPESWQTDTPSSDDRASAADSEPHRATQVGPPSVRIQSSSERHQHTYWRLKEPITNVLELENKNRTLALELGADNCWDATRVLRPPGTTNFGYGKPERKGKTYPVFIEELSPTRQYDKDDFKAVNDFRPLVKERLGSIPDINEVLAKQSWPDSLWKAFNSEPKEGKRSDQLQAVAYECAEAGFTPEQMYAVLLHCDDRWEKYKHRTDRDRRLVDIIDRAIAKHPFATNTLTFEGLTQPVDSTASSSPTTDEFKISVLYQYEDFMKVDIHIDWLLDKLLPSTGYGIIAGPTGVGKSQIALRLAESIASEKDFLLWRNKVTSRRTLFLSLEMDAFEVKQFLTDMGDSFLEKGRDNFYISPIGDHLPLDKPEGRKFLEDLLDKVRPQLLIIDSLSKVLTGFKDDDPTMEFNRYMVKIRNKFKCAVVVVHHNRKSQDKRFNSDDLDDLYGSRFLTQDASFVFMLHRSKNSVDHLTLNPAKVRFTKQIDRVIIERLEDLSFIVTGEESDNGPSINSNFDGLFDSGGSKQ